MTFPPANFDPTIDPTADQVRELRDGGPDGPVVMHQTSPGDGGCGVFVL